MSSHTCHQKDHDDKLAKRMIRTERRAMGADERMPGHSIKGRSALHAPLDRDASSCLDWGHNMYSIGCWQRLLYSFEIDASSDRRAPDCAISRCATKDKWGSSWLVHRLGQSSPGYSALSAFSVVGNWNLHAHFLFRHHWYDPARLCLALPH